MDNTDEKEKNISSPQISVSDDGFLVEFSSPFDSENPKNWPNARKWLVTGVLSATAFNRIMVSTIMAPALPVIAEELQMNSIESVMALSVFLLATAFGPLFIGPLSEIYGRRPLMHATNIWFFIWNLITGFAHTKSLLIASRFLAGFGASAVYALAAGVLGDVWSAEQRGRSSALYILIPLFGAAVGPIIGGFITEYTTWRWMFWSTSILQAVMIAMSVPLFYESHAPTILLRRAKQKRKETGDERYVTAVEKLDAGRSLGWVLMNALSRPMRLLLFHPIVQIQAVMSAFTYGITYLVLATFSDLWTKQYHESIAISGLHYFAMCLGEVAGALLGGPLMDFSYARMKARADGIDKPEFRVPIMLLGGLFVPVGLLLYGWAAQKHLFWLLVDIGAFLISFAGQVRGQGLQAYLIDAYPDHTSSASAASQLLRSLTAFGFPLFAPAMYAALGYGWGNSLMALLAIVIGIPAPLILWRYGTKLRAKARTTH